MKNYYCKWFRFCVRYSVESILHIKSSKLTFFSIPVRKWMQITKLVDSIYMHNKKVKRIRFNKNGFVSLHLYALQWLKMSVPYENFYLPNQIQKKKITSMKLASVRQSNEWRDRCMEIDLRLNYYFVRWMACGMRMMQPAKFLAH